MPSRVLVVEDNHVMREILLRQLRQLGVNCYGVTSAREAVELAEFFDLIFMDVQLPDASGIDATRKIRKNERARQVAPVPIIALTASGKRAECLDAGMDEFCEKPLLPERLEVLLRCWLFAQPMRLRLLG